MLNRLDAVILARFTRLAHSFQRATGLTNFFLAKTCCCFAMLATIFRVLLARPLTEHLPEVVAIGALNLLLLLMAIDAAEADERAAISVEKAVDQNIALARQQWLRAYWVMHVVTHVVLLVALGYWLVFVPWGFFGMASLGHYYFVAVDPLPPAKSKVREWLEKLSASFLKPVPVMEK